MEVIVLLRSCFGPLVAKAMYNAQALVKALQRRPKKFCQQASIRSSSSSGKII